MRYSFHGKVRATGQQVDGFVEAANATQAIDRLADQGIIGVYTVRPEAKTPKNAIQLSGEAAVDEAPPPSQRPRLENRSSSLRTKPIPAVAVPVRSHAPAAPAQLPPAPVQHHPAAPAQSAPSVGTESMLLQLDKKLTALMAQMDKLLSRPSQVVYQSGPVRGGGGSGGKKSSRIPSDVQNNTLRDIFQTNLDLRQSLEKLAKTVNPSAPEAAIAPGRPSSIPHSPVRDASADSEPLDNGHSEIHSADHLIVPEPEEQPVG